MLRSTQRPRNTVCSKVRGLYDALTSDRLTSCQRDNDLIELSSFLCRRFFLS